MKLLMKTLWCIFIIMFWEGQYLPLNAGTDGMQWYHPPDEADHHPVAGTVDFVFFNFQDNYELYFNFRILFIIMFLCFVMWSSWRVGSLNRERVVNLILYYSLKLLWSIDLYFYNDFFDKVVVYGWFIMDCVIIRLCVIGLR